jgi:uncharacterized protein YjiS (DUF1127 family)
MAFLLSSERPGAASATLNPVSALFAWVAARRAKRTQRAALSSLLDLDSDLLADLGIDRQDVLEALRDPSGRSGTMLAARRAQKSRRWLPRS